MASLLRTPDPLVERLLARWAVTATSRIHVFGPDQWDTWAARGLVSAIVQGEGVKEAFAQYVAERERACFTREEILTDVACLNAADERAAQVLNTPETGVLLADTYRTSAISSVLDAWMRLPGSSYLAERMAEEYRAVSARGGRPSEELMLTSLRLPRSRTFSERMSLSLEVAENLREKYPQTPIGCLSHVLFVALCWSRTGDGIITSDGLPQGIDVATVELPDTAEGASRLLADLEVAG